MGIDIKKNTLSVVLRRKNPEDKKRTLSIDITNVVNNIKNIVSTILDGPLRLIANDLNVNYDHGNISIDGDQVGDSDINWALAKECVQTIINNNK